jgi:hypothetical protein
MNIEANEIRDTEIKSKVIIEIRKIGNNAKKIPMINSIIILNSGNP